MFFTSAQILTLLTRYGYFIIFPVSVLEGPIVTMTGGTLVALGYLNFFWVWLICVLGDLVGDSLYYVLGRFGKATAINRWGKYLGISEDRVEEMEKYFILHPAKTLIGGKVSHAFGIIILVAAGMANVPYKDFIWYNLIGTVPKVLAFVIIGFLFGQAYNQINYYINYGSEILLSLAIAAIVLYLIFRKK